MSFLILCFGSAGGLYLLKSIKTGAKYSVNGGLVMIGERPIRAEVSGEEWICECSDPRY